MPEAGNDGPLADLPLNLWFVGQEGLATQRRDRYLRAAIQGHPGKMRPALARRLIETFSRPGDSVLDPMSGIGTTGVEAVHLNRHYLGIEREARFVAWQRQHLELARAAGAPGRFAVLEADARDLEEGFAGDGSTSSGRKGELLLDTPIDTVILSPPYGDRLGENHGGSHSPFARKLLRQRLHTPTIVPRSYGRGSGNIGNLTGAAYWQAMRHIYAGCFRVLRPGGLLVVVLQPNREGPQLLPLHHETARLCTELGFLLLDEIVAVLGRVVALPGQSIQIRSSTSVWRRLNTARLQGAGWPITLNTVEYVLVCQKPPLAGTQSAKEVPVPRFPVSRRQESHAGALSR